MMSGYYGGWRPYVSVGQRRLLARLEMKKLRKKGKDIQPVEIEGRTIARSFWGKGWCEHLESFGDYSNRLPRGRTYARNGSVCHLEIRKGEVEAIVSGSELYNVQVAITPLKTGKWKTLKKRCTGKIGSLVELLQGRLSEEIMGTVIDRKSGLFPQPGEIKYECDCPDWAGMCKHIAAVMYGIGARLDTRPELLFLLRGVDHGELIGADAAAGALAGRGSGRSRRRAPAGKDLAGVFGVELEDSPIPRAKPRKTARKTTKTKAAAKKSAKRKTAAAKKSAKRKTAVAKTTTKTKAAAKKSAKRKIAAKKATKRKVAAKKSAKRKIAAKKTAKRKVAAKPAPFKSTSRAVAALRRRHGMSRPEFARAVRVSPQTVKNWEEADGSINPNHIGLTGLIRLHERQT